ncbi:hypothetical protein HBI47_077860 [Parastagonospora nodorum]|nr:hypothetical protein HBI47_077860 [Parastagonospora nodorum]
MYVLRSALRASTGRPPARFIRGRRYPSPPRFRAFHTTRTLAQTGQPPSGSNNTPIGQNDASNPDSNKAAAEEQDDTTVASEDPELLAQKLQRSRETSRRYSAALRRQSRSKKAQGLPPVHVPDWFLKRRVTRREDVLEDATQRPRPACLAVTISDTQSSEQATCSIPASGDLDAAQVLSRLVRGLWMRRLDDQEKRKLEKYLSERRTLVEKTALKETSASADVQDKNEMNNDSTALPPAPDAQSPAAEDIDYSAIGRLWKTIFTDSWAATYNELEQTERRDMFARRLLDLEKQINRPETVQHDPTWTTQQKREAMLEKKDARLQKWFKKSMASRRTARVGMPKSISPLVLAEIRATVAASLSALKPSGDPFPAAKTNLILQSPASEQELVIDDYIGRLAEELQSDLIVLTAQDLAQLGGDYLGEGSEPTPHSIRSLGYETYRWNRDFGRAVVDVQESTEESSGFDYTSSMDTPGAFNVRGFALPLLDALKTFPLSPFARLESSRSASYDTNGNGNANAKVDVLLDPSRTPSQSETQLEDIKLAALIDTLLDADEVKKRRELRGGGTQGVPSQSPGATTYAPAPGFFDYSVGTDGNELELNSALPMVGASTGISMNVGIGPSMQNSRMPKRPKIVYVKDFKELNATQYGGRIVQKLEELVRKRRVAGESIMIIGSSCSRDLIPELSADGVRSIQAAFVTSLFRTIVVEGDPGIEQSTLDDTVAAMTVASASTDMSHHEMLKYRSINLSHIREMLRSLDPAAVTELADVDKSPQLFSRWATIFPPSYFNSVLTYDEVHRIALTALGLYVTSPASKLEGTGDSAGQMSWGHVILAMGLIRASDAVKYAYFDKLGELARRPQTLDEQVDNSEPGAKLKVKKRQDAKSMQRQRELRLIAQTATKHEKWLMPGIADADQIKTTFDQVHVPPETIDSIRTITSLSMLRPDAFSYGILATEKISGALLYGPPGTGKTLLAKAVAKESGSTVLEVSGAQIMGKFVGESEKNVAAIFSLAQKLSPCIVFLDEADSIFGSRDAFADRNGSHRQTLNQFLKEWDGLSNSQVFVMVATNRPFDLDDAVIRRLPRRLLVDLPTQADRKEILRIHLNGEQLDESVDLDNLAKRTPFYSGSDLKNIVVSAALACVKEENEQAAQAAQAATKATLEIEAPNQPETEPNKDSLSAPTPSTASPESTAVTTPPKVLHLVRGQSYTFPEKRTLHVRHFDKALQEISASISEDMSSLNAIKKFDEQYGDRKGKKRRKDFGFGVAPERSESAARVRL